MASRTLRVNTVANAGPFVKAMKEARTSLGRFSKRMKRISRQAKRLARPFVDAFRKIGRAASRAAKIIIATVVGATLYAIHAADKQRAAEERLRVSLDKTGSERDKYLVRLKRFASSIQQVTTLGDEEVLALMSQAKGFGVVDDQLEEVTKNAIGLAKALDMDVATAVRYVSTAYQGQYTILARYLPQLREVESTEEAIALIRNRAGMGFRQYQAEVNTLGGAFKQFRNVLGDVAEQFGDPFLGPITTAMQGLKNWLLENQDVARQWGETVVGWASQAVKYMTQLFEQLSGGGWREAWEQMRADFIAVWDSLQPQFEKVGGWILTGFGKAIKGIGGSIWGWLTGGDKSAGSALAATGAGGAVGAKIGLVGGPVGAAIGGTAGAAATSATMFRSEQYAILKLMGDGIQQLVRNSMYERRHNLK